MVKIIYDTGTDDTDTPSGSSFIQTSESNLDVITFEGTKNLNLVNLDEFEFIDFKSNSLFKGVIRDTDNGNTNIITGFDYGIELGEISIRKNFENMTINEIEEDVITNFTSLTYVANANIVDSPIIKLLPSQNKKANEIIDFCHKYRNTTHYVDNDKNYKPEYEGEELNPNVLQVGTNCDIQDKGWNSDTSKLCKNLTINGGTKDTTEFILLSGDGVSKEFVITSPYTDITVEYPIGTELRPLLENSQTGDYEIFKETKKILFDTIVPANASNNIKVYFTYQLQANFSIKAVTQAEILSGVNPHHQIITEDSLKEVTECQNYAVKYNNKFSKPLLSGKLQLNIVDVTLYRANQRILVKDLLHKVDGEYVNREMIIKKITRNFGAGATGLIIDVGDSTQFSYDKSEEIIQKIRDLNETTPTAEIFNEGIGMKQDVQVEVEIEIVDTLYVATLPTNILVYDANKQYTNEADHATANDGFIYLDEADYLALFVEVTE
jgi:hypothetical protein